MTFAELFQYIESKLPKSSAFILRAGIHRTSHSEQPKQDWTAAVFDIPNGPCHVQCDVNSTEQVRAWFDANILPLFDHSQIKYPELENFNLHEVPQATSEITTP